MPRVLKQNRAAKSVCVALLVAWSRSASAHDQWLVPTTLAAPAPITVRVSLLVGEDFVTDEEKLYEPDKVTRAQHLSSAGLLDVRRHDRAIPMLSLSLDSIGQHLVAVDRAPIFIELAPAKFESYLREEGLDDALHERLARGEHDKPGREKYARALKALVTIGKSDGTFGRSVGSAIELVPLDDPSIPRDELRVVARFSGAPLPGLHLERLTRKGSITKSSAVTGSDGVATLSMPRSGIHLIRSVHMRRCACTDADWESFWSSYTFATVTDPTTRIDAPSMFARPDLPRWDAWLASFAAALTLVLAGGWLTRRRLAMDPVH